MKDISAWLRRDFEIGGVKLINFITLCEDEKRMVLKWRNSWRVRKWMFNGEPITENEHFSFIERLKKDNRNFYWMAEINAEPSGVVSFQGMDRRKKVSYVGIYSVKKGSGRFIMQSLLDLWNDIKSIKTLQVELMSTNRRAHEFFKSLGFQEVGEVRFIGHDNSRKVISMSLKKRDDGKIHAS